MVYLDLLNYIARDIHGIKTVNSGKMRGPLLRHWGDENLAPPFGGARPLGGLCWPGRNATVKAY